MGKKAAPKRGREGKIEGVGWGELRSFKGEVVEAKVGGDRKIFGVFLNPKNRPGREGLREKTT